ncbi:MAG TPA: Rap1a/Tai family immunity protein [Stellaceae bacterium]|nr:Rap1a/Tai family immunity protein [Stellaceae bacterium]
MKALCLFLMLLPAPALAETALEMQSDCAPFRSAAVHGDTVRFDQTFDTGVCWGAFAFFQQAMRWGKAELDRALRVCPPPESYRVELIKIFLRYVDQHPEFGHRDFADVALWSLKAAFPCNSN